MSEMVDRVARAICTETGESPWDAAPDWMKNDYRKEARAAIAAMLDPTEEMYAASEYYTGDVGVSEASWNAMIHAALDTPDDGQTVQVREL